MMLSSSGLSPSQIESFHEQGFLIIPGVLSTDEVGWLRTFLRAKITQPLSEKYRGDSEKTLFNMYNRFPELRWLLFQDRSIAILKSLLGEPFAILPENDAHLNTFGDWHRDTDRQEREGFLFHWEKEYLVVNLAYYLQDNTIDYGGGLEVVVGSHRNQTRSTEGSINVPTRAGDLLIFDVRINHRASQPRLPVTEEKNEKIAIFHSCGRDNEASHAQNDYVCRRPDYSFLDGFHYCQELLHRAQTLGIVLTVPAEGSRPSV